MPGAIESAGKAAFDRPRSPGSPVRREPPGRALATGAPEAPCVALPARAPSGEAPFAPDPATSAGRPRIGFPGPCSHSFAVGPDPAGAIDIVGEIGLEGTDPILLAREAGESLRTDRTIQDIHRSIEQDRYPGDMRRTCRRHLEIMQEHPGISGRWMP